MIRRLLVANRGEIARRIFSTCRAMGIETVAVFSDADAGMPHVAEADRAVRLKGFAPADTYLNAGALVAAARSTGADAIHPGYGFLSENADFATLVLDAGLTWVGPPPKAIAAMGSKVDAKALLAEAGVPMLPSWTHPEDVTDYPVLVKASAGGGGRGMRVVRAQGELADALASARREAASAFGDGTVFVERYVETGRHIEVQIIADTHGTVVALGERDCSIQRRHQKIVEEAPSPAVDDELRAALVDAAVAAARAVGYVGAGTVEFLLAPDGQFSFLEMNTRLQVEHPVTECVYGVDLVRLQLIVAEGQPLPFTQTPPRQGHAIEVRLYAEDPAADWRPHTGTLHRFAVPTMDGLRIDSGVETGSEIGVHYDPMLAKVIAWAPSRSEAARGLASALRRAEIHGVVTNRDLLVRVLDAPEFLDGGTDTAFLGRHPEVLEPLVHDDPVIVLAAALSRVNPGPLPSGWRNVGSAPQTAVFEAPWGEVEVAYRFDRTGALVQSPVDGLVLVGRSADAVTVEVGGVRRTLRIHNAGDFSYVEDRKSVV